MGKKKHTYVVSFERTVRFVANVEVEATNASEAEAIASSMVDAPRANHWREDTVVDEITPLVRRTS